MGLFRLGMGLRRRNETKATMTVTTERRSTKRKGAATLEVAADRQDEEEGARHLEDEEVVHQEEDEVAVEAEALGEAETMATMTDEEDATQEEEETGEDQEQSHLLQKRILLCLKRQHHLRLS
eukprot:m.31501 g.31501  ORF g.31501 m.31501 type:complete len:123 (+) comp31507_c0_seq5:598-966(+)